MPNWCENKVWLSGLDTTVVDLILNKVEGGESDGGLLSYFHPMPEELVGTTAGSESLNSDWEKENKTHLISMYGFEDWYGWSCHQLGN